MRRARRPAPPVPRSLLGSCEEKASLRFAHVKAEAEAGSRLTGFRSPVPNSGRIGLRRARTSLRSPRAFEIGNARARPNRSPRRAKDQRREEASMITGKTAGAPPHDQALLHGCDLLLALESQIGGLRGLLEDSRKLCVELRAAIAAPRGAIRISGTALSQISRPTSPCAASSGISIVNLPVARCRATARAECWRQTKICFKLRCHTAKESPARGRATAPP
jgi:hypothetical protein